MSAIKIWSKVPDRSTLEIQLESNDENWVGGARLVDDEGNEELWTHAQLHPGPMIRELRVPHLYTVRLRVGFLASEPSSVDMHALILKPDGTVHAGPWSHTVAGKKDDIARASLVIATLKS